jgi:hypothetical protein
LALRRVGCALTANKDNDGVESTRWEGLGDPQIPVLYWKNYQFLYGFYYMNVFLLRGTDLKYLYELGKYRLLM